MALLPRPCAQCGTVVRNSHLCINCKRKREAQRPARQIRGYDSQWQQLSRYARAAQPWCSRCGSSKDLTADHIVPLASGGSSTLSNIQVLCRKCNSSKGKS